MTYRSSFGAAYGGGRGSPYATRPSQPDRSISDLFEYVDAGDLPARGYTEHTPAVQFEGDDAPDVIHLRYMGQAFKLEFPPYSISESGVTVQEVRKRVAEGLQQDPRRVRLVYKDRELKFDPYPIKKYGCKQNSELAVVVTESLNDWGGAENQPSSGDDSGSGTSLNVPAHLQRPRGLSSVRYRKDDGYGVEEVRRSTVDSSGYLRPNGSVHHDRKRSISPGRSKDYSSKSSDRSSTTTPQPSSTPAPRSPRADPNSPLGKVQALQDLYYDKWSLDCRTFLGSPPADAAVREREYRRLSESVMKHIIEAADAIEIQGDQTARAERKKVLGDAQELLRKLDAVPKLK